FQAEDGIRDFHVTGVQTCALPIFSYRISQPFVETLDSVRMNFNHSAEKLQAALVAVAQNARAIDGGANEIASAANDLAKRTEQQIGRASCRDKMYVNDFADRW